MSQQHYEKSVIDLCHLLGKILKVSRHSDPSASAKKAELLEKYKFSLNLLCKAAKESWPWALVDPFLKRLPSHPDLILEEQFKLLVLEKIRKDLSDALVPKPKYPEFVATETVRPAPHASHAPKAAPATAGSPAKKPLIKEEPDPVPPKRPGATNAKQEQAALALQKLVKAINKIGPDAIEQHLQQKTNPRKK